MIEARAQKQLHGFDGIDGTWSTLVHEAVASYPRSTAHVLPHHGEMTQLDETAVNVLVDGSAKEDPRRGGVGLLVVWAGPDGHEVRYEDSLPYAYEGTTNNRMEIQAVIDALKLVTGRHSPVDATEFGRIVIHTDSTYVYNGYGATLYTWPSRQWKTQADTPVLNAERWKELRRLVNRLHREGFRVEVRLVRGKSDEYTKRVDRLAKHSADSDLRRKDDPHDIRKKWSPKSVGKNSVRMRGQEEVVRVIKDEYLRAHRISRYLYEVIDQRSTDYQAVDYAFSTEMFDAGHLYLVRFNEDQSYPQIEEKVTEYQREDYTYEDYKRGVRGQWEEVE